jgi:hypothetical protein
MLFPLTPAGTYEVQLGPDHRDLLRQLASGIREVLIDASFDGDPALQRLFPPAYAADEHEKNDEYGRLMRDDLRAGHVASLTTLEATLDATHLTEEDLYAWMSALNHIRLFLGTRLEVTEDMTEIDEDDPRAPMLEVYGFLSLVQEEAVEALQGR